ncbi:MAG: hypothetical protein Q8N69_02195 [bacterium]|nr:hypothetical protein [bacterium]
MALFKKKRGVTQCPRCGLRRICCLKRRQKIVVDERMSVEYVLWCDDCRKIVAERTVFSAFGQQVELYNLCCPFCSAGRSRHHFFGEKNWAKRTGTAR